MVAVVGRDLAIDRAGPRVEERLEIAVAAERAEGRLPRVPLLPGAAAVAHRPLVRELLLHGGDHDAARVALPGKRHFDPPLLPVPGVGPVVDVDDLKRVEVDRVWAVGADTAEVIRVKDLKRQRLPASGRAPREHARPGLADGAEVRLDVRDQLLGEGAAVGSRVRRIDGVGVVVVRRRMLEGDVEHARKIVRQPRALEIRARPRSAAGRIRCVGGERRLLPEAPGSRGREVSLLVVDRIINAGVGSVVFRKQDRGADVDGAAPELGHEPGLEFHALDVVGVGRRRDGRDHAVERDPHRAARGRVEARLAGLRVEVARRDLEALPFPLVHVHLHGVAVGALKGGVEVEKPLDVVVAGGQISEMLERIAVGRLVDRHGLARAQAVDVAGEERTRARFAADLAARLRLRAAGDDHEDAPVGRFRPDAAGKGDLELERRPGAGRPRRRRKDQGQDGKRDPSHSKPPSSRIRSLIPPNEVHCP